MASEREKFFNLISKIIEQYPRLKLVMFIALFMIVPITFYQIGNFQEPPIQQDYQSPQITVTVTLESLNDSTLPTDEIIEEPVSEPLVPPIFQTNR